MTTKEEAKRFIDVLRAYADGEAVQIKDTDGSWRTVDKECRLTFSLPWDTYRIAPKTASCRVWLFAGLAQRRPCVIASDSPMDWDAFAKYTPNFGGWLTEPLEYEP